MFCSGLQLTAKTFLQAYSNRSKSSKYVVVNGRVQSEADPVDNIAMNGILVQYSCCCGETYYFHPLYRTHIYKYKPFVLPSA